MKLTPHLIVLFGALGACSVACGSSESNPGGGSAGTNSSNGGSSTAGAGAGGSGTATSGAAAGGTKPAEAGSSGSANGGSANGGSAGSSSGGSANGGNAGSSSGGSAGTSGSGSGTSTPGPALKDPRDQESYATVIINGQTWMAENLRFATATGSWCQNDDPQQCKTSGRYYDWSVALGLPIECDAMQCKDQIQAKQQGVCPAGWHVTTSAEWEGLLVGADDCAKVKASSGWTTGAGNNSYGLGILPTGYRKPSGFMGIGVEAQYWTTNDEQPNFTRAFGAGTVGCTTTQYPKNNGFSVRCIQN